MTPLTALISAAFVGLGWSVRDGRHHIRGVAHHTVLFPGQVMAGDLGLHRLLGGKGASKDREEE
jgi:hypothetical protein